MNAITRSSMSSRSKPRRILSINDTRHGEWASLIPDLLIPLFMRLTIIDLYACAGVCKEWRSTFIDSRSTLLRNQQPLVFVIAKFAKRRCFLHDISDGTRYKTLLPNLTSRGLVGSSCGYLIMLIEVDMWLVNPITRNKIHFPMKLYHKPSEIRAILFSLDKVKENLLFVIDTKSRLAYLSRSSGPGRHIFKTFDNFRNLVDVAYFNGYIHILTSHAKIVTMMRPRYETLTFTDDFKMYPQHESLNFYNVRINIAESSISPLHLVPSNDQLLMVSYVQKSEGRVITVHKLDKSFTEWIQVNDLGEDALFLSEGSCALVNPVKWGGCRNCIYVLPKLRNELHMYRLNTCDSFWTGPVILEDGSKLKPYIWYFSHQIDDKNRVPWQEKAK